MTADAKTILISRLFDAPPALVFECWLKAEHLVHWYSAGEGWTTPYAESDGRTGGRFKIGFAGPDGKVAFDFTGTYDEVTAPAPGKTGRIAFTADDGRPMRADFTEQDGKTLVTFMLTLEPTHSEDQQRHGWSAILANLGTYLERKRA